MDANDQGGNKWWSAREEGFGKGEDYLGFTTYLWPSDRPVFLRRPNEFDIRQYVQIPYFNLRDPKISEGRSEENTLFAYIRECHDAAKSKPRHIVVVRCKEYPWLVGVVIDKEKLVPATNFIPPSLLSQKALELPEGAFLNRLYDKQIITSHECSASYDKTRHADISGEIENYKRIIKIGSEKQPATVEDIRDIQEQLNQMPTDPNLTLFESHTIEFPHLAFLKKWDDLWHKNQTQKASCTDMSLISQTNNFEAFVARMAWIYRTLDIRNKGGKVMILPSHEPRKLFFGWTFINRENDECSYHTVSYATIKRAELEDEGYCGKMAQSILDSFGNYELSHLELNRYWNIYDPNSYCDFLILPTNQHREG